MKDLGVVKSHLNIYNLCSSYMSYGNLSDGLKNEELVNKAINHHVIAFGYSDYGGDEFDTICCNAIKNLEEENTYLYEITSYNGAQALVFGELADKISKANYDLYEVCDALKIDLDEEMTNLEEEYITQAIDYMKSFLKDDYTLTEEDDEWLRNWMLNNGNSDATYWDYSASKCEEDFKEFKKGE